MDAPNSLVPQEGKAPRLRATPATLVSVDPGTLSRTFGYLCFFGGWLALATLYLPHPPYQDLWGMVLAIISAFAVSALFLLAQDRVPLWFFYLFPALATGFSAAFIYYAGAEVFAPYSLFLLWLPLTAFYFFDRRLAILHLCLVGAAYALLLDLQPGVGFPSLYWLMMIGSVIVVGVLIGSLRERVDALVMRLASAARTDVLTGLMNRRGFEERFGEELDRAIRGRRALGLMICDLDHFKRVNDRFGHHAGDRALEIIGTVLDDNGRRIDTVARIGGEEFAVILPESDEHQCYLLAERLRQAVHRSFEGERYPMSISIGVASFPKHGATPEALLHSADQALYSAKELGRDRAVIYNPEITADLARNATSAESDASLATVLSLAEVLDVRHSGTAQHSQAVARCAEAIARRLGMGDQAAERLRLAGLLHDIGKVGIPDSILDKAGPLDEGEWVEIRRHPEIGARILRNLNLPDLADWVGSHHERPDGGGYPGGLTGEQIPIEAKVLAVADAYEAMTSDRVYRQALSLEAAREELERCSGTQFDVQVIEALLSILEDRRGREVDFAT